MKTVETMVGHFDLRAQLPFNLNVALQETHTEARVQSAWNEQARTLHRPREVVSPCRSKRRSASSTKMRTISWRASQEKCADRPWSEPLDLLDGEMEVTASCSSSAEPAAPAAPDPATVMPPTSVSQISRFLIMKLAYRTASNKDLGGALRPT